MTVTGGGSVSGATGVIGDTDGSTGTATVDGAGSTWTCSDVDVGVNGLGSVTVENQGLVVSGGSLSVRGTGTATINGGTIALDTLDIEPGGIFNFNFGTLNFTSNLSVEPGDGLETALGGSHSVTFGQVLQVDGTTTLNNVLTVGGGTFSSSGLINPQLLQFNNGTLQLTGAGGLTVGAAGLFRPSLSIGAGQNLDVTNSLTVDAGATLSLTTGGSISGSISAGAVSNSGQLHGNGTLAGPLTNNVGGEVQGLSGNNLLLTGSVNTNNGHRLPCSDPRGGTKRLPTGHFHTAIPGSYRHAAALPAPPVLDWSLNHRRTPEAGVLEARRGRTAGVLYNHAGSRREVLSRL
ncbi:hypothetical protein OAS39_09895 [Pirellulales bacterium]|nr:hypothetical protein [Pirellulales bacterium]